MTNGLPRITGLVVCHNGARWIPGVVRGLRESTGSPDRWVIVDTGSEDGSADLLVEGLASLGRRAEVVTRPADTSYGEAVRAGLEALPAAEDGEWIWLLHDDSSPAPHCYERLVEIVSEGEAELVAVGPKQREWPSLKRLLEVGVTVTGTGRRETGLEPGEYDQGQHDEYTAVLAVNTAGMLVRRDILTTFGFAPELPLYGNDLDFGWRVASAGHVIRIVPTAVIFHAEAAHRGQRDAALAQRPRRDERVSAMFTILVNGSARWHPFRLVRLFIGGLLRALGFLLVRSPADSRDELAALGFVYGHVGRMRAARRVRRSATVVPDGAVTPLLAPFWMPWRHGLDFVVDVARATYQVGLDSLERRRAGSDQDRSLVTRIVGSPSAWGLAASIVVAFVADRGLLAGAPLHGGALIPSSGVRHWWGLWALPWHWVGQGSSMPGPSYTFPLALAGSVLFGNAGVVVWLLFCMTVPLAYLGAVRFFRRVCPGRWTPAWAASAYALIPVLSGAVGQGRLGTVAVAVLLPWAATSALALGDDSLDRRRRALWRTILGLGLVATFAPVYLVLGVVLALVLPLLGGRIGVRERVFLAIVPALMSLTWLQVLGRTPQALLLEAGRADVPIPRTTVWHLLAGSAGGAGAAPWWITVGLPAAALVALTRRETRSGAVRSWLVAAVAALGVVAYARLSLTLPGLPSPVRPYPGSLLILMSGALITAVAVSAVGLLSAVSGVSFGWRQPLAAVAFVVALLAPIGGAVWWLAEGPSGPLHRSQPGALPAYLVELGTSGHRGATLVLTGGPGDRRNEVRYQVIRGNEIGLGDEGLLQVTRPDASITRAVTALFGPDGSGAAATLAAHGIAYVYAPGPVSSTVAGALDAADGFASASAPRPQTRVWQVAPRTSVTPVDHKGDVLRPVLVFLEVLLWITVIVLAAPSRKPR